MRRLSLFGAVLALLAIVYAVAWGTGSSATQAAATASPRSADVTSVSRACPPPGPDTGKASVALVSAPAQTGTARTGTARTGTAHTGTAQTGTATLGAVPSAATKTSAKTSAKAGAKAPAGSVTAPALADAAALLTAPQAAQYGGTQVATTGQLAEGFEAEDATATGIGMVTCGHPSADAWFVGTGQQAGAPDIWLYLTNTGAMSASVNVTMFTDAGVQNGLTDGITVPAHQYVSVNLAKYVAGSTVLAVHVQTSSGQVAANVWEDGGGSGGAWLPVAASPATQLVIPGLAAAGSTAKLFVTVPGPQDAQLKVTALTEQGKFLPFGTTALDAPAGASSSFPLSSLGASAAALVLTSNVPVTAGVLVPGSGIGGFTAAVAPVTEQGVVAGNPAGGGLTTGLVLSAPGTSVRVSVEIISSGNPERSSLTPQPRSYTVKAGHTLGVTVSPPKGDKGTFAIVLTPEKGSGPLYAARVVLAGAGGGLSGTLRSLLPVPSALTTIQLPSATDTYSAVLP